MSDVFISYSRLDNRFVGRLREALAEEEQEVWIDWESIPESRAWWEEIKKGIASANNFAVILSPNSMASPICHLEIEHAISLGKRIIPIHHASFKREPSVAGMRDRLAAPDQAVTRDIWESRSIEAMFDSNDAQLKAINYFFFQDGDDFGERFAALIEVMQTDFDHKEQHTTLGLRAQEWEHRRRDSGFLLVEGELAAAAAWLEAARGKQPAPTTLHREYIDASLASEKRRRRLARATRLSLLTLLLILVVGGLAGAEIVDRTQDEVARSGATLDAVSTNVADANRQIATATIAQGEAEQRANQAALMAATADADASTARARAQAAAANAGTQAAVAATNEALAFAQQATAVRLASEAQAGVLSAFARQALLEGNPMLALSLAYEATRDDQPPFEAAQMLFEVAYRMQPRSRWVAPIQAGAGASPPVSAAAYHPDGETYLLGTTTLYTFDSGDGRLLHTWEALADTGGEPDAINAIAYSGDGQRIAVGYNSGLVIVYASESREVLYRLNGDGREIINHVGFSPDGRYLLTSAFNALQLWDAATGEPVRDLLMTSRNRLIVDGGLSGEHVVAVQSSSLPSGATRTTLLIWSLSGGDPVEVPLSDVALTVAFNQTGDRILVTQASGSQLFDLEGNQLQQSSGVSTFNGIFCGPEQAIVLLGSGGEVTVYDADLTVLTATFRLPNVATTVACDPDHERLVIGTTVGSAYLWELAVGDEQALPNTWLGVDSEPFDPVTGDLVVLDVESLRLQPYTLPPMVPGPLFTLAHEETIPQSFQVTEGRVVSVFIDGSVAVWDRVDSTLLAEFTGIVREFGLFDLDSTGRYGVNYTPDAVPVGQRGLHIWDAQTGEVLYRLPQDEIGRAAATVGPQDLVPIAFAFVPGQNAITTSGLLESFELGLMTWHFETDEITRMSIDARLVTSLAYSDDGRRLLIGGPEGDVTLWDVTTERLIHTLPGLETNVLSLDFSPDGRRALGSDENGNVTLWDTATGQVLRHIWHIGGVFTVAFHPDGMHFAVANFTDQRFITYLYANHDLAALRAWVRENRYIAALTCEQRITYGLSPCIDGAPPTPTPTP